MPPRKPEKMTSGGCGKLGEGAIPGRSPLRTRDLRQRAAVRWQQQFYWNFSGGPLRTTSTLEVW